MIIEQNEKYITLTLNESDTRALRSLVNWAELLEKEGKLDIFEYQKEFMNRIKEEI